MPCMPQRLRFMVSLLFLLLMKRSESLQFPSNRRAFFKEMATKSTAVIATTAAGCQVANAIDVSGLKVEKPAVDVTPGRPPNQPPSGPLSGTKFGYQVGGGPRSEEEVRAIDAPRYEAVRKAQGLGPKFLEGLPVEPVAR